MGIKIVTTGVVASECGVSKTTVLRWIERGYLKTVKKPSGYKKISTKELEIFKKSWGIK